MSTNQKLDSEHSQPPIGIDLGTTYSAIASIDAMGAPYCIPNQEGEFITPTALLMDQEEIVVGREAVNASAMEPHDFAECFKRDMGASVFRSGLRGVDVPPQVLNAFVLEQLKKDGELVIGPIQKAVVTVPAFFDEGRRKATQDAGALAGLEVLDIINEPTAAALAYGYHQGILNTKNNAARTATKLLVYDLGGGTFDVTILEIKGNTYRAIATDGDVQLGGKDFDERLVEFLASRFIEEHGVDIRADPQEAAQLWMEAEKAKQTLSQRSKTTVVIGHLGVRSRIEITRDKFQELTRDLLARSETTTSIVLKNAGLEWSDIDRVLLVGGSSRMPAVAEMLRELTGQEPDRSLSPDQAVAHGAAIHAAMLMNSGNSALGKCNLINVNSHSLGVRGFDKLTQRHANAIMIPKNTPLPCRIGKLFRTSETNQSSVQIVVLEGESMQPSECIELGNCVIRGLPSNLPAGSKVEVVYEYAADGRLSVKAKLQASRQSAVVDIHRSNSVELGDLASWRQRLLSKEKQVTKNDPGSILKRLDELYFTIGRSAVTTTLPATLQRPQATAQKAIAAYRGAKASMAKIEQGKDQIKNHSELVLLSSNLAKAKTQFERTESQARFSCIVLGRQCYREKIYPKDTQKLENEITAHRESIAN